MNMITKNHNYDGGYIGLVNLSIGDLPKKLSVDGYDLLLKTEHHISLICAEQIASLVDASSSKQIESEIVEMFIKFTETNPLNSYTLIPEFRLVKREERVALIIMAEVPGIVNLFKILEDKYSKDLPLQPTHITLYTLQPEKGIGTLSIEYLIEISKVVKLTNLTINN